MVTEVTRSSGEEFGNRVTLWVTSPVDGNGCLGEINRLVEKSLCQKSVIKIEPKDLKELEDKIHEIKGQGRQIENFVFICHSLSIAAKITCFIIQMPDHPQFNSEGYFGEHSSTRRIPSPSEYESFDRFVEIIRKGLVPRGKVFLLGCSTAVDTEHPEKNIATSVALRLPSHTVIGTNYGLSPGDLNISDTPEFITGRILKQVTVEKPPYNAQSRKVQRVIERIFSPNHSSWGS